MAQPIAPAAPRPDDPPPLPPDATQAQRDEHWLRHVYQGDSMPQLTVRAVCVGAVIGMFMSISNLYTHLKLGWGFGVAITACVVSYVSWSALRALSGRRLSKMTILENNCMQSTASAAGYSTGNTLPMAFGALLMLTDRHEPWTVVLPFTFFAAALGVLVAIPMKRQMINVEQLKFPTGTAAAETLKSLYSEGREAMQKAYALVAALVLGGLIGLLRAPHGAVKWLDRVLIVRIPDLFEFPAWALGVRTHKVAGWGFEPSALLVAAGMIVGLRVSLSLLLGSVLLYFVFGPMLLRHDLAMAGTEGYLRSIDIVRSGTTAHFVRWAIWGGSSVLMFASLTSLAMQWRTIARAFRVFRRSPAPVEASPLARLEVPLSWLVIGIVPVGAGLIVTLRLAFDVEIWMGVIGVALAFVISLACARATGETDTTPTGAMGKVTQLVYALLSPQNVAHNLMTAGATSGAGLASADLLTDLKSGYILGANPRKQFIAQFVGCFFGALAVVPAWYLMVPDRAALEKFEPPAVNTWHAVAQALTKGLDAIPHSAQVAIAVGAVVGVALPLLSALVPKARPFLPSAIGLGLSWAMPFQNSLSFALGAVIAALWTRFRRRSADTYNIPIASGLIAGESIVLAIVAILATLSLAAAP